MFGLPFGSTAAKRSQTGLSCTTDASHDGGTVSDDELEFVKRRAAGGRSYHFVRHLAGRALLAGIGATQVGHLSGLRPLTEVLRCAGGLAFLQIYDGRPHRCCDI